MYSEEEMIKRLERLKFQIDGAISLIRAGCVRPVENYKATQTSENTLEIGDFVVMCRRCKGTGIGEDGEICNCQYPE